MDSAAEFEDIKRPMKLLTLSRNVLLACLLVPACGDDKGDDSTATDGTSNATPATPASGTETDTNATPASGTDSESDPSASVPTEDPSGDPSTDPSGDPSTDPTGDTSTTDPTGGDGQFCQEACAVDDDCNVDGMNPLGFKCVDNRCQGGCADDTACVNLFSGFITPCVDQAGCPGQVCIDIGGGEGRCALAPSDFFMCEAAGFSETEYPPIEGGAPVVVCANTDYECVDGQCQNPCADDSECVVPGFTKCYTDTGTCGCPDDSACTGDTPKCMDSGICGCESDATCTSDPNRPVCAPGGFCGCGADADCVAAGTGDKCYDGACGCSDASACPAETTFDNTMFVCEGF